MSYPSSSQGSSSSAPPTSPVLALDTATLTARVALVERNAADGGGAEIRVRATREASASRHSANVLRLCDEVLRAAEVRLQDLAAIACGSGPGSFTGLRVGMAVAKGLAMPLGLPLLLVSSLEALARDMLPQAAPGELLLPCLDAGKDRVYAALFEPAPPGGDGAGHARGGLRRTSEDWDVYPAALAEQHVPASARVVLAGSGAGRYRDVFVTTLGNRARLLALDGPSAAAVATIALERLARGETDDLVASVPAYVRPPDITRPKQR